MNAQAHFAEHIADSLARGLSVTEALEGYVGGAQESFYLPGHRLGMEVPTGGSSCARCKFWLDSVCSSPGFIRWNNGSGKIPVAPDSYCCDLFEADGKADPEVDQGLVGRLIAEAMRIVPDLEGAWPGRGGRPDVEESEEEEELSKTTVLEVDFMGESVRVSTIHGEFARTPKERGGLGLLEFTMGGNEFGGPVVGYYRPMCDPGEVVLHDLMALVDFVAVACHEMTERYVMKTLGLEYGFAHDNYADPVEYAIRLVLA